MALSMNRFIWSSRRYKYLLAALSGLLVYYVFFGGLERHNMNAKHEHFRQSLDRSLRDTYLLRLYDLEQANTAAENIQQVNQIKKNYQRLAERNAKPVVAQDKLGLSEAKVLRPFDPDKPKFFHLLSYQRCGSSLVGDLFQNMSQVFYIYEPLDALYTAMYGTVGGWNVPSDIFIDTHGQVRKLSKAEREMTEKTLDAIFNCQMSALPFPMLMHRFWIFFRRAMPAVKRFTQCATKKVPIVFSSLDKCRRPLRKFCGTRFNQKTDNAKTCFEILYHNGQWNSSLEFIRDTLERNHPHILETTLNSIAVSFVEYFVCILKHKDVVTSCAAEHLDKSCRNYPIRAVKTVRGFAEVDQALSEKYSNFRLIHLVRDPRGTAKSRFLQKWSRGLYEQNDAGNIAEAYCKIVEANDKVRAKIEEKYPGKTLRVIFDAFSKSPRVNVRNIFQYMNENITDSTALWVSKMEKSKLEKHPLWKNKKVDKAGLAWKWHHYTSTRNVSRVDQWKVFFTYHEVETMNKKCKEFFDFIRFPWAGISNINTG